jgi:two-component system response regulator FlrC
MMERNNKKRNKNGGLQMDSMPVIVLVGQNTLVSSRIKNIFADQNMKICEADSRRELSRILSQNHNIDLILTEIGVDTENGFNGIKLIQQVKAQKGGTPVVMLSSIGKKEVITRCLREGAVGYILKPFQDEYLKEKVLKLIETEKPFQSCLTICP